MKALFTLLVLIFNINYIFSQEVLILQPSPLEGKDSEIRELHPDLNYADSEEFISFDWTFSGTEGLGFSLIQFNLSELPDNIEITSAKLSLYYNPTSSSAGQAGNNACYLKRITSAWEENTVTWNNAPNTTNSGEVQLEESTSDNQDYLDIDILNFVSEWYNNPETNYGLKLEIIEQELYNSMKFCSSDYSNPDLRPKLIISYQFTDAIECINIQPNSLDGKDAEVRELHPDLNYADSEEFISFDWTFSGTEGLGFSFIQFNLDTLPQNITIDQAKLSLFYNPTSSSAGQAGNNACYLKKVISDWEENTITWNNTPNTTDNGEVQLEESTSDNQDYLDIDILNSVSEWYNNPETNYGLKLEIIEQELYNSMKFCSSDYSNPDLRPKLEICYHLQNTSVKSANTVKNYSIFPNPSQGLVFISNKNQFANTTIQIFNSAGQEIFSKHLTSFTKETIDLTQNVSGIYLVRITGPMTTQTQKIIIK